MGARVLSVLVVAGSLLLLPGQEALAGREWCAIDPILGFQNGMQAQWLTQFSATNLSDLNGPVRFWVEVPSNIGPITVSFPAGPAQEQVTISYTGPAWDGKGSFLVHATIAVNATSSFPTTTSVRGNVAKDADITGESNVATRVNAKVDPARWYDLVRTTAIVTTMTVNASATVTGP